MGSKSRSGRRVLSRRRIVGSWDRCRSRFEARGGLRSRFSSFKAVPHIRYNVTSERSCQQAFRKQDKYFLTGFFIRLYNAKENGMTGKASLLLRSRLEGSAAHGSRRQDRRHPQASRTHAAEFAMTIGLGEQALPQAAEYESGRSSLFPDARIFKQRNNMLNSFHKTNPRRRFNLPSIFRCIIAL